MSESSPPKILQKYLNEKRLIHILLILVIVLALAAGYYNSLYQNETKKYLRLEDMYVRVKRQLGENETSGLIDLGGKR